MDRQPTVVIVQQPAQPTETQIVYAPAPGQQVVYAQPPPGQVVYQQAPGPYQGQQVTYVQQQPV